MAHNAFMDLNYLNEVAQFNSRRWWKKIQANYPSVGDVPSVRLNKRLKARMGYAQMYCGKEEQNLEFVSLSVDFFWLNTQKFVDLVIPHELMHIAAWRVFADKGHGKAWKKMMREFGLPDTATLNGFTLPKR